MISASDRQRFSDIQRPSRELDAVYSENQRQRLLDVVWCEGPSKLIITQYLSSLDELASTGFGGMPDGSEGSLQSFVSPGFRGFYANHSTDCRLRFQLPEQPCLAPATPPLCLAA